MLAPVSYLVVPASSERMLTKARGIDADEIVRGNAEPDAVRVLIALTLLLSRFTLSSDYERGNPGRGLTSRGGCERVLRPSMTTMSS